MKLLRRGVVWSRPPDIEPVFSLLKETSLFRGEDDRRLRALAAQVEERQAPEGEVIIKEGRLPTHLYLVHSGRLDVLSRGETEGAPRKVNELQHPDHFGEIGLIEGMPSTATVRAASDAGLYRVRAEVFLEFVRDSPLGSTSLKRVIEASLARTHPSYMPAAGSASGIVDGGRNDPEGSDGSARPSLEDHLAELGGLQSASDRDYADRLGALVREALAVSSDRRAEVLRKIRDLLGDEGLPGR